MDVRFLTQRQVFVPLFLFLCAFLPIQGGAQGQASDIQVEAQQILRIRENLTHEYARMTGQKYEQLLIDMDRDNFMSAAEGLEYGLIDRVIEGTSQAV